MTDCPEPETTTLTFVADYEGETVAADENTGNLYSGRFDLTLNWGDDDDTDNITARIITLKGVYGSTKDWFQHDSQDVGTTFLSGIGIDGDATTDPGAFSAADATAPSVRFCSRATGAQEGTLTGTATISGDFAGNCQVEGPLGVLGTWSIAETAANGLDFKGSFGADLRPWSALQPQRPLPLAGRTLAPGPPALSWRRAGMAPHPSAFRTVLPTSIGGPSYWVRNEPGARCHWRDRGASPDGPGRSLC